MGGDVFFVEEDDERIFEALGVFFGGLERAGFGVFDADVEVEELRGYLVGVGAGGEGGV